MSDYIIKVENLGKKYRIRHQGDAERYLALRDVLARGARAPLRWLRGQRLQFGIQQGALEGPVTDNSSPTCSSGSPSEEDFWALRDVSFEVKPGEVVGILGRNGAGKSSLLKILSRVTEPSAGRVRIGGRVASLLEIGTGFHPELTGRENIFVNGAILGMTRREIQGKFDEIVAFAEIENFLDTPVKRYSSGMHLRLAFAVAAHLEPEILLIDEVLAVGDTQFQKKCLGKMDQVAKGGRTILFVSHQMTQIRRLCNRALWIDAGRLRASGLPQSVVNSYEAAAIASAGDDERGGGTFVSWEILPQGCVMTEGSRPVVFRFRADLKRPVANGHFGLAILNQANLVVAGWAFENLSIATGRKEFLVEVPALPLRPGAYSLTCSLFDQGNNLTGGELLEQWNAVPSLLVEVPPLSHPQDAWAGVLNIAAQLQVH